MRKPESMSKVAKYLEPVSEAEVNHIHFEFKWSKIVQKSCFITNRFLVKLCVKSARNGQLDLVRFRSLLVNKNNVYHSCFNLADCVACALSFLVRTWRQPNSRIMSVRWHSLLNYLIALGFNSETSDLLKTKRDRKGAISKWIILRICHFLKSFEKVFIILFDK